MYIEYIIQAIDFAHLHFRYIATTHQSTRKYFL
jgi:hypothetical protein